MNKYNEILRFNLHISNELRFFTFIIHLKLSFFKTSGPVEIKNYDYGI